MIGEPPQALLPLGSLYNVHSMHNGRLYFDEIKTIMNGEPPQVLLPLGSLYNVNSIMLNGRISTII